MNDRLLTWSPLLLVALLAALTFWLDRKVQDPGNGSGRGQPSEPDFTIENFSAVSMNADGTRRYALSANRLLHFAADDSTRVEAPQLVYFDYRRAPVSVRSRNAELIRGGEEIVFRDDVHIAREAFEDHRELGIFTDLLKVFPEREIASTDRPVRLVQGDSTASAVGLEFDNQSRRLKLLSQTRATYAIPRRATGKSARSAPPAAR